MNVNLAVLHGTAGDTRQHGSREPMPGALRGSLGSLLPAKSGVNRRVPSHEAPMKL